MKQLSTLLIAVFLFTAITPTKAQVNTQDSLALVDLYDSTGGPNWTNHTNWLTSAPVSSWYGITVSGGRVTGIILFDSVTYRGNNLVGYIPTSIGNLTNLKYLYLSENKLTGTLPTWLSSLTNLNELALENNQFTGYIPAFLGKLNQLTVLNLFSNQLSGTIPTELGNLTNLSILALGGNQLSGNIPSSLGNLTNLTWLFLSNNQLSGSIPSSLFNLTKLTELDLSSNNLNGSIPSSIGNLISLGLLFLDHNKLSGAIPTSLVKLPSLSLLELSYNQFTFAGMEWVEGLVPDNPDGSSYYAPQATVPLNNNNNIFSVSVGGTPSKNTFKWYKDGNLVATIVGDSTYTKTSNGTYWVIATNSLAGELTLYSDTITITDLPIKSINLQAKETNGQALLQWQTIDEINTASFTIQHSTDGETFSDIGTREAVGSGNNGYSFSNLAPINGVTYYRIKAIDKDGSFSYSNEASLTINDSRLTIFPNPVRDVATIKGNHIASVQMVDNNGKVVNVIAFNDATNPSIKTSDLAAGVYYLHIKTTDGNVCRVGFIKE